MSQTLLRPSPRVLFIPEKQPAKPLTRRFKVVSEYEPNGDQPTAIAELVAGVRGDERDQVLLGVTGSGKTFTMAKVIEAVQKPTLILAPNKTLAAQLYGEMKGFFPDNAVEYFVSYYDYYQPEAYVPRTDTYHPPDPAPNKTLAAQLYGEMKSFFPDNAVEYFVSYYDYYQPEAYVPRTDTYIEKDAQINEQIDRMRHAATQALLERNDVVIVASVSCIYGIGSVETYAKMVVKLETGGRIDRDALAKALVDLQYRRNDTAFQRGTFRLRGDIVDIFPSHYEDRAWRVTLFGDEVEAIHEFDPLTGEKNRRAERDHRLRQQPLRHAAADADAGDPRHQGGAEGAAGRTHRGRQAAGGRTAAAAHDVRHRDDGDHRLLQRHRELFALSDRTQSGRAAADAVRIPAGERAADRRRKPRDGAAVGRHVSRRLQSQVGPGGVRLPAAVLRRQPAAEVRGVGDLSAADDVRLGDAGPVGDGAHRRRVRRAGDPSDRA